MVTATNVIEIYYTTISFKKWIRAVFKLVVLHDRGQFLIHLADANLYWVILCQRRQLGWPQTAFVDIDWLSQPKPWKLQTAQRRKYQKHLNSTLFLAKLMQERDRESWIVQGIITAYLIELTKMYPYKASTKVFFKQEPNQCRQ